MGRKFLVCCGTKRTLYARLEKDDTAPGVSVRYYFEGKNPHHEEHFETEEEAEISLQEYEELSAGEDPDQ